MPVGQGTAYLSHDLGTDYAGAITFNSSCLCITIEFIFNCLDVRALITPYPGGAVAP